MRRWPRISASSRTPPKETRTNFRPRALAMLLPSEVLPTPGGPTKQRMGPRMAWLRIFTAMCSRMRSFTFFRPKWSWSSTARAAARSWRSRVSWVQGTSRSHST
ncbi:MAG: hypothetical protein A3I72_04365 [Candidatus Tectomicrobia bacterium RIFCSPLOWO2_02_FULL_70_19]|nr:MAG: hypothetical protein A3I72_04365 [Candidatus Tectomicrobia bacterium RIFCSPLOWO2_02_FULL_70_19]